MTRSCYFSQGGIKGGGSNIAVTAAILPLALFGGLGLSVAGFFGLAQYTWLPVHVRGAIISVIFLVALFVLFRAAARGYRRVMSALKMPMEMDPAADVNVICWPDQMERLQSLMPSKGTTGAFEPEACRVWVAKRVSMAKRVQDERTRRRVLISIILFPILLNAIIQLTAHNLIDRQAVLGVVSIALTIPIAWGFIHPTFLRVSPGRVDIVRFGFLNKTPKIETHSLRDCPIRVDLRRKELLIGGWSPSHPESETPSDVLPEIEPTDQAHDEDDCSSTDKTAKDNQSPGMFLANQTQKDPQATLGSPGQVRALIIIPLWATTDARVLEDAVFRAAISTAEPGPLPDDRLIG